MTNWYFKHLLKKRKKFALYEIETDLKYIEAFQSVHLYSDEGKLRRRMVELNDKKQNPDTPLTEKEEAELSSVVNKISKSKATKSEHEKLLELKAGLTDYIKMLV